jgi:hypothetical protein
MRRDSVGSRNMYVSHLISPPLRRRGTDERCRSSYTIPLFYPSRFPLIHALPSIHPNRPFNPWQLTTLSADAAFLYLVLPPDTSYHETPESSFARKTMKGNKDEVIRRLVQSQLWGG